MLSFSTLKNSKDHNLNNCSIISTQTLYEQCHKTTLFAQSDFPGLGFMYIYKVYIIYLYLTVHRLDNIPISVFVQFITYQLLTRYLHTITNTKTRLAMINICIIIWNSLIWPQDACQIWTCHERQHQPQCD